MLGIRELTSHLLFIAEREGCDNERIYKSGFEKIVFLALGYCYKHKIKVRYDMLFLKTDYGATSEDVKRLLSDDYGSKIKYNNAKEVKMLSEHEVLDNLFASMIKNEENNIFTATPYITNTDVFRESNYKEHYMEYKKMFNYLIIPRDVEMIWSLAEILQVVEAELDSDFDYRVPLKEDEYNAITRYMALKGITGINDKIAEFPFTMRDIQTLRYMSDTIIESVELHGAYLIRNERKDDFKWVN